ncbi:hypothetical protein TNCV_5042561 [Trichonephila clavipes]|nr:hypothetical protein TNCV_5042561 [Trichonephila clavipes]
MLNDKSAWGHCLLFDLGGAPTPRLAVIMVKRESAPLYNRRTLRREESPGGRDLEVSAKERDWDRDWSGREGETMNARDVGVI